MNQNGDWTLNVVHHSCFTMDLRLNASQTILYVVVQQSEIDFFVCVLLNEHFNRFYIEDGVGTQSSIAISHYTRATADPCHRQQ